MRVLAWVEHPEPARAPRLIAATGGQRRRNSTCDGELQLRRRNWSFGKCCVRAKEAGAAGAPARNTRPRARCEEHEAAGARVGEAGAAGARHGDGGPLEPEPPQLLGVALPLFGDLDAQ